MKSIQFSLTALALLISAATAASARDYVQIKEDCARLTEANPVIRPKPAPGYEDAVPLVRYPPKYPQNSPWRKYVCVALRFDVNEKGRTENVEIIEFHPADAPSNFRYKARDAIEEWTYSPATQDGMPVYREGFITVITYEMSY